MARIMGIIGAWALLTLVLAVLLLCAGGGLWMAIKIWQGVISML